jgi:excinuclease UvrABC ATPase subunit
MKPREHIWHKCKKPCFNQDRGNCQFCDGGLGLCTVCGAFEGQLLSSCPGYMLNEETLDACYQGNVKDFIRLKRYAEHGFNIRKGIWERR